MGSIPVRVTRKRTRCNIVAPCSFSVAPYEESHPASRAAGSPRWVRISRPKIGKRLAQRGIFQAQGEDILAKGEIPVCSGAFVRKAHDWVRISRPKIGKRLAQQDILQAESVQIFARSAKFPQFDLVIYCFTRKRTGTSNRDAKLAVKIMQKSARKEEQAPPLPMDGLEILAKRFIKLTYRAVGEGLAPPHYRLLYL